MAISREKKQKVIEDLKEKILKQRTIILVDFTGLKVKDFSDLRRRLKLIDGELKVAKKTLIALVLKKAGLETEVKKLKGEIALAFGFKDEISPAKIVWQFSQENPNFKILGGFLENSFIDTEKIIELAKLPTREELLARLVGSISAPISNFVNILKANIKGLLYVLSAIKK